MKFPAVSRLADFLLLACAALALASGPARASTDFNGDGKDDIVWRTHAGNPLIWQMAGLQISKRHSIGWQLDASSALLGSGTLYSDASPGLLWINSSNELQLWRIDNNQIVQICNAENNLDSSWQYLAMGDFNGDGTDDAIGLLPNNTVIAYLIHGCTPAASLALNRSVGANLRFAAAGDVDGDGYSDLLWRNASDDLVVWHVGAGGAVTVSTEPTGSLSQSNIKAVADLDGNGIEDLVWRSPGSSKLVAWLIQGSSHQQLVLAEAAAGSPLDDVFHASFEVGGSGSGYKRPSAWHLLESGDFNGDHRSDLLLASTDGRTAIWQMQGATVSASSTIAPEPGMPLPGLTGWALPLSRPTIGKQDGQVEAQWESLPNVTSYTLYTSSQSEPAQTGSATVVAGTSFSFHVGSPGFENTRYFSVSASYNGIQLPPSRQAFVVDYDITNLGYFGALAIADINKDGCTDILGALGDCDGNFQRLSESDMGMSALRSGGRAYRDLRFADLNGDGVEDVVANVYSSISDSASRDLMFIGTGNGHFVQDSAFADLDIRGYGETIVIADFDNDRDLDIYLPEYSFHDPSEHCRLLINDGQGHFTDIADSAGVANRNSPADYRVEGAQAVDLNDDGWIDLYVGSHMFINNGDLTFTDVGPVVDSSANVTSPSPWGLPAQFDEGAKFIDFDNSGHLSLVLNSVNSPPGLRIFRFDGMAHFYEVGQFPNLFMRYSYGLNAADADGDGLTDLVVAGGCDKSFYTNGGTGFCGNAGTWNALPQLLINRGGTFIRNDFYDDGLTPDQRGWSDLLTHADFNDDGTPDWVARTGNLTALVSKAGNPDIIVVTAVGKDGSHNQAGRVVRVRPLAQPSTTMTQVVDGGSGYMSNGPYTLTFAAPWGGAYQVSIRFASGIWSTIAHSGDRLVVFADGHVTFK